MNYKMHTPAIKHKSNVTGKKSPKNNHPRLQRTETTNCIFLVLAILLDSHLPHWVGDAYMRWHMQTGEAYLIVPHRFSITFTMHAVKAKENLDAVTNFPHSFGKGNCRSTLQVFQHRKLVKKTDFNIFISYVLLHNFWTRELVWKMNGFNLVSIVCKKVNHLK